MNTQPHDTPLRTTSRLLLVFLMISSCASFQHIPPGVIHGKTPSRSRFQMAQEDNYDLKPITIGNRDFWTQQKELAEQMIQKEEKTTKEEQMMLYEKRANALVEDTAFFTFLIFPLLWLCFDNPLFSLSYLLGAIFGLAYSYGLGKYVATLGGSVDDVNLQGAGVGGARFAFLILLFVFVGKFRSMGLVEIPCIAGFFTYQLASLSQGLKEFTD